MIRQNKNVKVTVIGETEHKISHHADDTEIILEGGKNLFEEIILTVETFWGKSGFFLNAGKTSAIWFGNRRNCPIRYMPHLHMEWNPPKSNFLEFGFLTT